MAQVRNGAVAVDGLDQYIVDSAKVSDVVPRTRLRSNSYDNAMESGLKHAASKKPFADAPAQMSGWRRLLPFVPGRSTAKDHDYPMLTAGWLSLVAFHWANSVMFTGFRRPLEFSDLWKIHPQDSAEVTGQKLQHGWKKQLRNAGGDVKKAKLGRAFFAGFGRSLVLGFLGMFFYQLLQFLSSAIFVFQLVSFAETPAEETTTGNGIFLACMFFLNEIFRSFFFSVYFYFALKAATRFRASLNMAVFDKVMRLRNLGKMTVGQVVNLCVNDGQRLFECGLFVGFLVGAPTMSIAVIIYSTILIGWPAILGCTTFYVFYPLQGVFGKRIGLYRRHAVKETDMRVRKMNEILNCVKLIKMYAWEGAFAEQIAAVRDRERKHLQGSAVFTALTFGLTPIVPVMATAVAFSAKTLTGGSLTASEAFSVLAAFNAMRFSLAVLPFGVRALSEAMVALPRMKELLGMPELVAISSDVRHTANCIELQHATLAWDARETADKANPPKHVKANRRESKKPLTAPPSTNVEDVEASVPDCLIDLSLSVRKGEIIGVCGAFGSGKSSLLSALLGGLNIRSGTLAMNGSVAYVAQQAWIINASLRDNILFGKQHEEDRYKRVLAASALQQDLEILPDGDLTEIGERGINLSGGQKQRVSLARALYAERDVYLLDDPLSAVDAHVGSHIFNELIKKELSGKTVILVTHQLQYLPMCDRVIMMAGGCIAEEGTYTDLMAREGEFHALMKQFMEEEEEIAEDEAVTSENEEISKVLEALKNAEDVEDVQRQISAISTASAEGKGAVPGTPVIGGRRRKKKHARAMQKEEKKPTGQPAKLVQEEDRAVGSIRWSTYVAFTKAGGGIPVALFLLFLTFAVVTSITMNNWWLTYWLGQGDGNVTGNGTQERRDQDISQHSRLGFYVLMYYVLALTVAFFSILRSILFMLSTLRASSNMHNHVFKRVFRAPMSFFDTTPTGRILNRFSKDLDEIDSQLPWLLSNSMLNGVVMAASILVATVIYPILLAPIAVVGVVFFIVQRIYARAIRELKRLDNISRSPMISHLGSSIQGLTTIHAFKKNSEFITNFKAYLDQNTVCMQAFQSGARWIALRLDLLAATLIFFTALFLVLNKEGVSPALAGLAITYMVQIGGLLQFTVRTISETQARFTSVERINYYATKIPVEAPEHISETAPPKDWPQHGQVTFENVKMRYREGTPLVLHDLNFSVKAQEKIGVIGRTGAGKSSLAVCLLRLVEVAGGRILIDGVDISMLGLNDLRTCLSIIPQDPVLFVGSIRYNLDPFDRHSDEAIAQALERTHLKDTIDALPDGLQTEVLENGENFSVGERQLMCMARALLRHSKVLILDEATASIDSETDALIQRTIRECFADCTLLTIAHRLNTVLDSDRLLVMDEGRVAEFDTPAKLLTNPNSVFTKMLAAARESKDQ